MNWIVAVTLYHIFQPRTAGFLIGVGVTRWFRWDLWSTFQRLRTGR